MEGKKYRIIYVGQLWDGSTCLQRMEAFESLGHTIIPVDTSIHTIKGKEKLLLNRIIRKIYGPCDFAHINQKIILSLEKNNIDILWIDKGLTVKPDTISQAKKLYQNLTVVSYSPDDMINPDNQSKNYLKCIPLYDLHVTTKSYNVKELKQLSAQHVLFIDNAFCHFTHLPINVTDKEKARLGGRVGFIGAFENDRAEFISFLAKNDINIKIWGSWPLSYKKRNIELMGIPLWGTDYAKAICSFDINICFLRKINRDLQTSRSIEIPACGGFMLAERTREHLRLFEEGKEAEFFDSREELLEKALYYIEDEEKRKRIAAAGRRRCVKSGYSNRDRLKTVLQHIEKHLL